jgi:hypothetical protein
MRCTREKRVYLVSLCSLLCCVVLCCVVLCCVVLSCLVSPNLVLPCVLSWLGVVLCCSVVSCLVVSCLLSPYLVLSCVVLCCLVLCCLVFTRTVGVPHDALSVASCVELSIATCFAFVRRQTGTVLDLVLQGQSLQMEKWRRGCALYGRHRN